MCDNFRKLLPICCVYMCESLNLYILYPFSSFLLAHYGVIDSVNNAGYYSGLFTSVFALSQFMCCGFWGRMSDKVGRKNVILVGLIMSSIWLFVFGFSSNIYMALVFRFLTGLFNGNAGIVKTYVSEISNSDNKAVYYALLTIAWSVGAMLGPFIGGYLYDPYFISTNTFHQFPALLPCLIAIGIYIITIFVTLFVLSETNETEMAVCQYIKSISCDISCSHIFDNITNRDSVVSILIYVVMTIIDISMSEILPLWMVTSHSNGGLDYDPIMIGYILIIASGASIGLQPIYNLIEKRVKRLLIFRICIIFVGLLIFLIPYTNLMNINIFAFLCIINTLRYTFGNWCFSLVYMFVSSSVKNENTGEVNGISQSSGAICKIIFPLIISSLFSWSSTSRKVDYLLDQHFVFNILALVIIVPFILSLFVPVQIVEREDHTPETNIIIEQIREPIIEDHTPETNIIIEQIREPIIEDHTQETTINALEQTYEDNPILSEELREINEIIISDST
jgi:MFS family permease